MSIECLFEGIEQARPGVHEEGIQGQHGCKIEQGMPGWTGHRKYGYHVATEEP
jgi:hypothetical protein